MGEHPVVQILRCNECKHVFYALQSPNGKWVMIENWSEIDENAIYNKDKHVIHNCKIGNHSKRR